jgi:transposase
MNVQAAMARVADDSSNGELRSMMPPRRLYIAFELGLTKWKLAMGDGQLGRPPRFVTIDALDFERFVQEAVRAKKHYGMPPDAPIWTCYEAGREAFSLHRVLTDVGCEDVVVDPASIQVDRRARRVKTDRVDAAALLMMLMRSGLGERPWRTVRVPSVEAEDQRQLHRDLEQLKVERGAHLVRIQSLLFAQGFRISACLSHARLALTRAREDGLPPLLVARLAREIERLELVESQIKAIEDERKSRVAYDKSQLIELVRRLARLGGVGITGAWVLVMELFGWRKFKNRREVGASVGLAPTPYASGSSSRCQGISKIGRSTVRTLVVQLAWGWLKHQPDSPLTKCSA